MKNYIDFTHFIYGEHHLNTGGPSNNADWATSGYDMLGTFRLLHSSYSALTSKCMQYVQTNPMKIVPIAPVIYPEFLNAFGMAKIPVPKDPLSKWKSVSQFLKYIIMVFGTTFSSDTR